MNTLYSKPNDPRGLIYESYRIEGITKLECRSIFFDWAMSMPVDAPVNNMITELISEYKPTFPDHPMSSVLEEGLRTADTPKRRGGARARTRKA